MSVTVIVSGQQGEAKTVAYQVGDLADGELWNQERARGFGQQAIASSMFRLTRLPKTPVYAGRLQS